MRSVFITAMLLASGAFAQTAAGLDGVWVRGGGAGRGGPTTQWSPDALAFTPAGQKQLEANKSGKGPRAVVPAFGNDPMGGANPPGLYRTLIYNRPFEMVQLPGRVVQLFEWAKIWRVIWTDGRPVPDDIPEGPYWYGYSVGKWEGDTLVVQTMALDERAWFDEWGTPFSSDARVEERWRRVSKDKMELVIKVTDPTFYVKPWVSDPKIYTLQPKGELIEMIFAPMDEIQFNNRIRDPAAGKK
ncbi:MAG: hypothetical protein LAP61_09610 [Acidobacteriia bacterium]|nr:hypothetical protein [Terriglobia bacterium]